MGHFGCGELVTIAQSGDASLHYFVRGEDQCSQTVEHAYPSHSVVFTDTGSWRYHGSAPDDWIDSETVIAGTGRRHYECSHPHGVVVRCFIVALSNAAIEDEPRLFSASTIPRSAELLLHRRGIERAMNDPQRIESLAFSLFDFVSTAASRASRVPGRADVRMAYAKRLIAERCSGQITVSEIANELNLSRFTFSRRFMAHTGMTPHAYLAGLRIERAKRQLAATQLTIDEIALGSGYGSLAHFSNAFRHAEGMSPTAFRRLSAR